MKKIDWTKIKPFLVKTESFQKGDIHQAILDIAYDDWQQKEKMGIRWGYQNMIEAVDKEFGEEFGMLILLGKYNQQVCNGGHIQYFDNGYASNGGGCMQKHGADIQLHNVLRDRAPEYIPHTVKHIGTVLVIMNKFEVEIDEERMVDETCDECNGSGMVYVTDEETEIEDTDTCSCCGGTGSVEVDNQDYGCVTNNDILSELDTKYYEVESEFMESLNQFMLDDFNSQTV